MKCVMATPKMIQNCSQSPASWAEALSPRELEVLRLVVEGQSNPEIAAQLHISLNTVKTHVRNITGKFGVGDRLQAAVFAVRNGIV
jgi:DNA-binding NarL/FixJ family response regulator